jgi:predicted exporter
MKLTWRVWAVAILGVAFITARWWMPLLTDRIKNKDKDSEGSPW